MLKKVSIVVPLYNSKNYIAKCIESILHQTYSNWELIIVDDCSNDNPELIIKNYQNSDKRIQYVRLSKNMGSGIARNEGIKKATGQFIAFLDSDDLWKEDKLEKQISYMLENHYVFTYTDYYIVYPSGNNRVFRSIKPKIKLNDEIKFNYVACSTVIYDSEILGKVYMPPYRNRQDWGLWLDILKKTDYAYCLSYPLTYYTLRKDSISSNKLKLIKYHWQIYRKHLKGNFFVSLFRLINNIILHIYYGRKKKGD